ncbi:hypothetical protein DOM22_06160 [Bdellovibrio sp. ZAP7]|uniref:hypothetical protein n=1 Tax=Bdellovibrio sp. ZAP7 TaxID=2231053 RepID=UPI0011588742|nr:hypothetical protein [Bdellovibrio sp. ZAP7]QDK44776.1 hypothetical protein DOM22_06160 [Bdellovibrio sp. ZAP7]
MKSVFVTLALLISANPVFAGGVYLTSNCTAYTIDGNQVKIGVAGRPMDAYRIESDKLSEEENLVTWDGIEKDEDGNIFNLVLKQTNRTKFEAKNYTEECFENEAEVTVEYAVVKKVSKKISQTLNIKKGQKLAFVCQSVVTYGPVGKCN